MDKAKAYDEALEKARARYDKNPTDGYVGYTNQILEELFPQLKESDDERIRKDIIDHFESIKSRALYDNQEESDNIISSCNEKIAYLEKQKEPKVDIDKLRRDLYQSGYNDGYQHGKEDTQKEQKPSIVEKLREISTPADEDWFEIQKQWEKEDGQKPDTRDADDLQLLGFIYDLLNEIEWKDNWAMSKDECLQRLNNYRPQKPAEWSEEDEMMRENIISDLRYFRDCATDEEAVSDYEEEIAWLKDIFLNHKKFTEAVDKLWSNEWSEEDKRMLSRCIKSVECSKQFADSETYKAAKDAEMNWLEFLPKRKNLPPKQEWSEEDEEIIYSLRSFLILAEQSGRYGSIQIAQIERCLNWLKYLRPQKLDASKLENFDPVDVLNRIKTEWPIAWEKVVGKREWSEDDKQMIDLAVDAVEDFYNGGIRSKIINLLKSLHPSWKPSKKQMDALKNIAYGVYQNGDGPALRELYEQLLKLGVKEEQN